MDLSYEHCRVKLVQKTDLANTFTLLTHAIVRYSEATVRDFRRMDLGSAVSEKESDIKGPQSDTSTLRKKTEHHSGGLASERISSRILVNFKNNIYIILFLQVRVLPGSYFF